MASAIARELGGNPSEWTLEAADTVVRFPSGSVCQRRIPVLRGLKPVTENTLEATDTGDLVSLQALRQLHWPKESDSGRTITGTENHRMLALIDGHGDCDEGGTPIRGKRLLGIVTSEN